MRSVLSLVATAALITVFLWPQRITANGYGNVVYLPFVAFNSSSEPPNPSGPRIDNISPSSSANVGDIITITGSRFSSDSQAMPIVYIGYRIAIIASWSDTEIQALVPNGDTGNLLVFVIVGAIESNYYSYYIIPPPTATPTPTPTITPTPSATPTATPVLAPVITTIEPISATRGTPLTITGNGFGTSQAAVNGLVYIASENAGTAGMWDDTTIVIPIPLDAPTGTMPIAVVANARSSNVVDYEIR